MRPTDLPVAIKNSGTALEELVPVVLRSAPNRRAYLRISQLYRRLAVGTLLLTGDAQQFFGYLFKAARAFVEFCARADPVQILGSCFTPALDAMVCRDEKGVALLAGYFPEAPNPSMEYEEDYYYVRILISLYQNGRVPAEAQQWFVAYERLVSSGTAEDYRLGVCRALISGEQNEVDDGLALAAERVQQEARRRYDEERWEMDEGNLFSRMSIDVVAWTRVVERMGLVAPEALAMAPIAASPAWDVPLPAPDAWRRPEPFKVLQAP